MAKKKSNTARRWSDDEEDLAEDTRAEDKTIDDELDPHFARYKMLSREVYHTNRL